MEDSENGTSEASQAKRYNCDIRTIRKGIEGAQREREVKAARMDILKQALLKHQQTLMCKLEEIISALTIPKIDWAPLSWYRNEQSVY